jgi:hypothetical protein
MASLGKTIVIGLADRMNQRREFLAEQRAAAQENLRRIEAGRRSQVSEARQTLQQNIDYLITRGLREDEVSQLLESDPREVIRLGTRLYNDEDIRIEDVRAAAQFREDYAQETPLSELIRQATPIFRDIEEPDPAARQQNLFQRLFSLNVEQDMDRFYRESNFGGFSGYDILGSMETSPYRERTGEALIDYGSIASPTQLTNQQKEYYLEGASDSVISIGESIIGNTDIDPAISRLFDEAGENPRRIIELLLDDSPENMERYELLRPYRERMLEELATYYDQYPTLFTDFVPTFGSGIEDFVREYATGQAEAGVVSPDTTNLTLNGRPEGPQETSAILDRLENGGFETVTIVNPETGESRIGTPQEAIAWIRGSEPPERDTEELPDGVDPESVGFSRDYQTFMSRDRATGLIRDTLTKLRTGEFGPGSAPVRRFFRYLFEDEQEVLDEAEAIQRATDMIDQKESKIMEIILYDEAARNLFEEDPLRFLEEYSDQLNGE